MPAVVVVPSSEIDLPAESAVASPIEHASAGGKRSNRVRLASGNVGGPAISAQPLHGASDLEQVLEQTGETVIHKDINAIVTLWNREATALYGFSEQEAVG